MTSAGKQAEAGVSTSIRKHLLAGTFACLVLVGGLGGWAALTPLSGAVIAHGQVDVSGNVKRVQHRDGGIVEAIHVADGDRVKAGDVVVRLDATTIRANLAIVETQIVDLLARRQRLLAEREGGDALSELALGAGLYPGIARAELQNSIAAERRLFQARLVSIESRKSQLGAQVTQSRKEIDGLQARLSATRDQLQLTTEELDGVLPLWDKGLVSIDRLSQLRRSKAELTGTIGQITAQIASSEGQILERQIAAGNLEEERRAEAETDLRETDGKLAELVQQAIAARDQLKHIDIRAPQDGIVHELAYHTVGGVIPPGETIAIIVPVADELIVNARIKPTDVDMVAPGQAARLRLTAFNSRRTPEVNARVGIVSADATVDPATRESYYLARIKIPAEELGRLTEPLLPGMPVEAYVTTSERTTLDYLLKPLTDQFARALREE
ncbi:Type I secretion system membrane fusion protein PrsE [uncultured Pleomorphomonas sp.]|uniref:Membrane fusion protein (MFP) family protein n=1 Tax=uncultured Pleomorphomonas sp. TaxID=442121 RepID=A0A212LNB8_9HYPH|nr:HlyD family type I secretion periplasmic adaptor subunit [uncultured Pleomorphomonas sp.]SCM79024.1 Type I secretion system membrane fusion protein PrsE [uncultured Pleomorphomonas sp.]